MNYHTVHSDGERKVDYSLAWNAHSDVFEYTYII
jgi:hypothetical protein